LEQIVFEFERQLKPPIDSIRLPGAPAATVHGTNLHRTFWVILPIDEGCVLGE